MRRLQLWFKLLLVLMLIAAVQANADANIDAGTLVRRQGGNNGDNGGDGAKNDDAGGNDQAKDGGADDGGKGNNNADDGGDGNAGKDNNNGDGNGKDNADNNNDNNNDNNDDNNNGKDNGKDNGNDNGDDNGDAGDEGVVDDSGDDGGDDGEVIDGGSGGSPIRVDMKEPKQVQEVGVLIKIGAKVDLKWEYSSPPTGGKVTIEARPLLDGSAQQGDPVIIAANLSIRTTEYEWDTRKSRGEWLTEQLETAQYMLKIYDSTLPDGETRSGRISPFSGVRFKMYKPQRYLNFNAYISQNPVPRVYWVGPTRWTGQIPAAAGTFVPTATIWVVTWASAIVLAYAAVLA